MTRGMLVEPIPNDLKEVILTEQEGEELLKFDEQNPDPKTGRPRTTTYLGVPILQNHSIRVMARKIIKHNQKHQFTSVSNIGTSGGGKTSSSTNLVHEIHEISENEFDLYYTVRWVGRKELLNFDKFLKSLAPVPTILIFEDISYALEMVKKAEKIRIKEAFTEIRHTMGEVNVIVVFHYHYTRGMDKMMRSSKFSIFCTIDHEEKGNLLQIYGYDNKEYFDKLEYRLRGMDENGWCTVAIDDQNGKQWVYYYGKPFNIALSVQNGVFHFFFYANYKSSDKVWCNHCAPFKRGTRLDPKTFVEKVASVYGMRRTISAIKWWGFIKGGKRCIHRTTYQTFKYINKLFAEHPIEGGMDALLDYIEKTRKIDISASRQMNKDKEEKLTSDIVHDSVVKHIPKQKQLDTEVLAGFEGMTQSTKDRYDTIIEEQRKKHSKEVIAKSKQRKSEKINQDENSEETEEDDVTDEFEEPSEEFEVVDDTEDVVDDPTPEDDKGTNFE
jgi:hypothetical protein